MANQYRKATLKFAFRNEFARPRALEVERFLKEEAKIAAADIVGIHFSILSNTVFVKLINDATCEKVLREMNPRLRFCHPDGSVGTVEVDHVGLGLRTIRIFELPFELPAAAVVEALRPYGTVHEHVAEKWAQFKTYPVLNGVRQVRIDLRRHVPSYLVTGGCRAVVLYDGQPKTCSGCGAEGHLRSECLQRRITQLPPKDVEPTPTPTILPVTYAAALTKSPPVQTQSTTVAEPDRRIMASNQEDQSAPPATEIPTITSKPTNAEETAKERVTLESLIVPTEAFVPARRDSVASTDTEGHVRKQSSPKRRKRRRRNVSDQEGSHSMEGEEPLPHDTNDEGDTIVNDPSYEEWVAGQAATDQQSSEMNIDQREGSSAGNVAALSLPINQQEPMEHEQTSTSTSWGDEVTPENNSELRPSEAPPDHPVCSGYDFFTQVWPEEEAQVESQPQQQQQQQPASRPATGTHASPADKEEDEGELAPEETEDDVKLLAADYLGLKEDEDWEVVVQTPARRPVKMMELLQKEAALYFYPSSQSVPLLNKLAPGCEPRYPEEEGLYVGKQLHISSSLRNRMEQRILAAGGRKWFGDDGKLICMPDPQVHKSYNPPKSEELHPGMDLEYKLARSDLGSNHQLLGTHESNSCYLLEFQLLSIKFTHHPLFSREHVLSQQLTSMFRQYAAQQERDPINRLFRKLDALRRARDSCLAAQDELGNEDTHKERLERYKEDILQTQLKLLEEGRSSRNLLARILSVWKDLRTLRQLQGYSSTPLQLRVMCQPPVDREKEQREWENRINMWSKELLSEKLKSQAQHGNTQQKMRTSQKSQGKDEQTNGSESTENEKEHDSETEPYTDIDEADVRSEVANTFCESFRPPGEPDIVLSLNNNNTVDQEPSVSREQKRRSAVLRTKLFVKIFYNEKEVCQSNIVSLTDKFEVKFEQLFNICALQYPDSLKLEIWEESSALNKNIIADVYIPPPNSATTLLNCETGYHEFSNNTVITFNHTGVGSGTFCPPLPGMQLASNSLSCLYTSGVLECRTGWGKDEISGEIMAPPEKSGLRHSEPADFPVSLQNQDGNLDPQKLKEWAEKSHLDPNDPRNASFFYFLKNTDETWCRENSYFRLNPLQSEFDFCTAEELDSNPRLRLLKLRDRGEPEFRGLHLVPLREKEILPQIFVEYEKRISAEPNRSHEELPPDPLDSHRMWGQRFLLDVQQRILQQCHAAQQNKQPQDIVSEDQVPDIGTLGLTFMKWLQPKRPLRPVRKERKKVTTQNISTTEVKIIINIVRAFDVPVRKDVDTLGITTVGPQGCKFTLVPVRPFVEVSFQDTVCRTTTAEGANPTWNQELQIQLHPPGGDYSHGTLQSIKDSVHFNLFDEIVIDLLADDSIRETNIHQRLERNWLGSLKIPFSTLYFNSQVEGTFKLYSPPVLLGYERESQLSQLASLSLSGDSQLLKPQNDATFLTLFITVQPPLNPPELLKEKLESTELPHVQEHLEKWEEQILAEFPHRKVKTLVTDISGKTVCVTRFFRALAPPDLCGDDGQMTAEMAARYVAMIPVISGNTLFPGLFDVWLTSDQVVRLLSGDCEDHAVLLCCYLLHLGMQAWLLLGVGVPHGPAAYVLTRDAPGVYRIWDPVSGQACSVTDAFCPLQKTYCLINEDNIWANIQNEEMPHRTHFDVSRKSDWYPAFGRNVSAPTGSVQPPSLEYTETSLPAVQQLQDKIEKYLQKNIMQWRKTSRTIWNRYCIAVLRKLLPEMEKASLRSKELGVAEHIQELQQILGSHKVCGFPINMPYTNMEAINETVKATGVHNTENEETEFALAVYIHPYPGNVLSVWIYVASLIKRR